MVKIAVNNVAITAMKPVFVTDLLDDVTVDVNQDGKALRAMNVSVYVIVCGDSMVKLLCNANKIPLYLYMYLKHFVLKHEFV